MSLDVTALFSMSYGLYVVSATDGQTDAACLINTATQVTAEPPQMIVAVHKDNTTTGVIQRAGAFTVTAVDKTADMVYLGNFGFRNSSEFNKFERYERCVSEVGSPYSPEHACAVYACRVKSVTDAGSHLIFLGEIVQSEKVSDNEPLTYAYYHSTLKGKTPPRAASYRGETS